MSTRSTADIWKVQAENLTGIRHRFLRLAERDLLLLDETAPALRRILAPDAPSENLDAISGEFPKIQEFGASAEGLLSESLPETIPTLNVLYQNLHTVEQVSLCHGIIKEFFPTTGSLERFLFGEAEQLGPGALGRISYQHNIFADEAYLRFARYIPDAKSSYSDSFPSVCEQVFNGVSEYCILPLENSRDGKLLHFYTLIQKYELKLVLTCEVTSRDTGPVTTFGLCRRDITRRDRMLPDLSHTRKPRVELIFRQDTDHPTVGDVLNAAELCSLHLLRADTLPRTDDEILVGAPYPFDLSFEPDPRGTENDLYAFLLYLAVNSPNCLPLGIYYPI